MPSRHGILVVDDDPNTRSGLMHLLAAEGYDVLTAADGQQAIDMLEDGIRPGLMLIDLTMPRVGGTDLIEYLHSDPELRGIPTIVITGRARDEVKVMADAVFCKPIELRPLLSKIAALTRR